jgi:hypothetical protein
MFQADDNLAWKQVSQRFGLGGGKSGSAAAPATAVAPAVVRNTSRRMRRRAH